MLICVHISIDHWNELKYPFSSKLRDEVFQDIWNGEMLQGELGTDAFFSAPQNLAFSLFTDGIPLFKSSSTSLWPVYLVVNNLPPSIRMNSENIVLCSLWCGPSKPPMHSLLDPIVKTLEKLATTGIALCTPEGVKIVRGKVVLGIFDLPAKAAVLNMKQFNGEYGCSTCLHPGIHQNGSRVYLPQEMDLRSNVTVHHCAAEAERTGTPNYGIKGVSVLSPVVDLVKSVPVDYMHAVLEGVTRWLLRAWFESKNHSEPYYLGRHLRSIDEALLQQHPPSELSRPPRSISKHMNYWKASELRSWLLYYSLPLLIHCLPSLYFHHYSLFVCAIHILLQDSITEESLLAAEQMTTDFIELTRELYGDRSCTANLHSISHIPMYVRLWGPLWTHSAFGFESKNGHIKNMFHSKSSVTDQLVFAADVAQTLNLVQPVLEKKENPITLSYLQTMARHPPRQSMTKLEEHTYAVGKIKIATLSNNEASLLAKVHAQVFFRAFHNGMLLYRNNSVCMYHVNQEVKFGEIQKFVLSPEPVAIVYQFEEFQKSLLQQAGHPCRPILKDYVDADIVASYIYVLKPNPDAQTITQLPIRDVSAKVVLIAPPESPCVYAVKQPNNFERH